MPEPSLESLFDRYRRRGDLEALARVFDRTAPELLRIARHMTGSRAEAEDALQETFLAVIEQNRRFSPSHRLVPWLCGILANKARRLRRSSRRAPDPDRLRPLEPPGPAEQVQRRELALLADRALEHLPQPYRQVLTLHLREGLEPTPLARSLGRSPETVRTQIRRGLDRLRRVLPAGFLSVPGTPVLGGIRARILARAGALAGPSAGRAGLISAKTVMGGCLMKKVLLVTGIVLLLGTAAFWYLGDYLFSPAPPRLDPGSSRAAAMETDRGGTGTGKNVSSREPARRKEEVKREGAHGLTPNPVIDQVPAPPTREITVVDADTGRPVAGASLTWYFAAGMLADPLARRMRSTLPPIRHLLARRPAVTTDGEGKARVPLTRWEQLVCAHKEDKWGWVRTSIMPGVVYVIHISSYREVELQVVDPSGKPASQVPLAILAEVEGRTRTIWRGLSAGPGGTVKASFLLGGVQRLGEVKLFAACHIPAGTGEKVPLPPDPTGRERVRLTLPPTGSILVEVQDGSGRPLDLEGLVTIEEARPGKEPGVRERWLQDAGPAVSLERGRALFPRVALGRTWTIRLGPADAMSFTPVHSSPLEGPREPGRVVRLSLTVKRTPRVTGRIVDSRGRPRVGIPLLGHLEMRIGTIAASLAGQMTLTDEDGRFTFAMDTTHVWERSSPAISWKLTWWLASDGRGRPGGPTAEPPLPDPLLPGVNDLGDILLADPAPEPLLAAGVVRDSRGKPVVGIEVVARSLADGRGKDSLDTKTLVGRTDREGRFEIFGILPEPVEVSARSWSLKIEKREITPGTRDLELVLLPAPELGGVLLVDPELPLDPLQVVLRDRHGRERGVSPTRKRSAWLEKESPGLVWNRRGGFVFKGVEPGRYDLSVRVGLRRIAGLGDVVVPRFGAARDPRLQGIDLRGHLRRQLLRVRDRQGQAIDNCTVLDLEDEEKPVRIYRGTAKGKEYHELLLLPECTRLAVGAPGWRPVRLTTAVAPLEVRLERGARVRIELKVPGRLRRRKLVYLEIRPAAADMTPAAKALLATGVGEPILAAPAGKVTRKEVALPGPGRYRARWIVKNGKRRLLLPCDEPPFFEVSGEKDPIFNFTLSEKEGDAVLTR